MEEGKPLAKDLRFVILLDPQSLSCVDRSETLLQFVQGILVHGIICLRKWLDFPCGHRPRQTPHTVYSLRPNSLFYRTTWFICTPVIPCLLYTSDAADEEDSVDLGGRRIIKK